MKAVSDVIAPLSGEVLEVNQKVVDAPETVNERSVRRGLAHPDPAERRVRGRRPARRGRVPGLPRRAVTPFVSLTERDEREMLDAIGVASVDELFRDIPEAVRFHRELDLEPRALRAGARRAPRGARRDERRHGRRALVPRRRHLRPLRAGGRRRRAPARRAPDRVHAVPARDEPGRAPGDLRVPDRDLRADRDGRLERVGLRRRRPSPPTPATSRSTRPGARRSSSPRR